MVFDDMELVGEASSGQEAIHLAEQAQPDVILMDLIMPDIDGAATTRLIRARWPKVQVVALTSFREARPVGIVLLPLVVILLALALVLHIRPAGHLLAFRGAWLVIHVVLAFIGYVGLAVAFAAGLLYLLQFRELKGKRFGRLFRFFPPLATLDRLGRLGLQVGFPALTMSLIAGWAWTVRFEHTFAFTMPQVIWGMITWVIFVAAMLAGRSGPTRARRSALASVVGFAVVVAAYVILRVAITGGRLFL